MADRGLRFDHLARPAPPVEIFPGMDSRRVHRWLGDPMSHRRLGLDRGRQSSVSERCRFVSGDEVSVLGAARATFPHAGACERLAGRARLGPLLVEHVRSRFIAQRHLVPKVPMSLMMNVGRRGPDVVQLATSFAIRERAGRVRHPSPAVTAGSEAGKPGKHAGEQYEEKADARGNCSSHIPAHLRSRLRKCQIARRRSRPA